MKVVLSTLNAKYIHTSLALRCLKAYCRDEVPIEIVEFTIKDPVMNIVADLYQRKPDVLGFSCYIWNIEETIAIIRVLRKIMPELKIVLGGPEVSYDTEYWMERLPEVDFIIMGEGEETFLHLLRELAGQQKFHFVYGLAYRKQEEIVLMPPRPKLNLDELPSPHRFSEDIPHLPNRIVYFETSRGCPFSCQFCLSSIESGVRYFDIERTKADLLYLIGSGARLIKFVDRTFNIKREYAMDIFRFLIEHHQDCVFQFEITADIMPPDILMFLAEHAPPGIFRFEIGVQSTNDATNLLVKRRQNFAKLSRTVSIIKNSGSIAQHLDLIAGLPEEDYTSFRNTFNDVFALGSEELQLGFLKMLRGTGLRHDADKYGYVYMDHAPYEMLSNRVMPFSDIVKIKRVEDVLEKYWNAHRMDHAVQYVIQHEFPSAFDFFQSFGDYWEEQGWQKIGHQLDDLFVRLREFLLYHGVRHFDICESLLKLDYLLNHKYKPRKIWWSHSMDKRRQIELMRWLAEQPAQVAIGRTPSVAGTAGAIDSTTGVADFASLALTEKELHKHATIELVPAELAAAAAATVGGGGQPVISGERPGQFGSAEETLLIVYYPPDAAHPPLWFTTDLRQVQKN